MDTLLYAGQIVVGAALLVVALAVTGRLPARFGTAGTLLTTHADVEVTRSGCRFGIFFATAAIVFGVTGLAGLSPLPAVIGVLFTGMGLISVLLAMDTTPMIYRVSEDGFSVLYEPRTGYESEVLPEPRNSSEVVVRPSLSSRQAA